jgi:hypothetical protein
MAFRWKTGLSDRTPGLAGGLPVEADGNMQGFVPNSAFSPAGGMNAPVLPEPQLDGYGESLAAASNRAGLLQQLNQLESQLAGIDAQIAEIDRAYPGLKNGPEWDIAAKRAEIGDMSAYDNLVSRRYQDGAAASGIDGELYSAEKTLGGLKSKSDEDREIVRGNIEATLRRAEEWSARTGKELPQSYYRLKRAVADSFERSDDMNARQYGNELALKIYRNTATDDDIERGIAWAEQNPNSEAAKEILEAAKSGKYNTEEAKARAARRKKEAYDMIATLEKLPKKEQEDMWWKLSEELRKEIGKYAYWDTTGKAGLVRRVK